MKVAWNKVTPLSRIIALALFIALPFLGFWYGIQYGGILGELHVTSFNAAATGSSAAGNYYENAAAWPIDPRTRAGFLIAYPIDFNAEDNFSAVPAAGWRNGAAPDELGITAFTLAIPRALEPQTNFGDARLTVGYGSNGAAAENCLKPDATGGPALATSTRDINGIPFTVFHSNGAGAGNYYDTTSYRAIHGGRCWSVEYTIHSTQIANYPASYGLRPFDRAYVAAILDRIAGTFAFTK